MEVVFYQFRGKDGSVSEQLSEAELLAALRAGRLTEESPVSIGGGETWLPAWRVPSLGDAFNQAYSAIPYPTAPPAVSPEEGYAPPPPPEPEPLASVESLVRRRTAGPPRLLAPIIGGLVAIGLASGLFSALRPGSKTVSTQDGVLSVTLPATWQINKRSDFELEAEGDAGTSGLTVTKFPTTVATDSTSLEAVDEPLFRATELKVKDLEDHGAHRITSHGLDCLVHEMTGTFKDRRCYAMVVTTHAQQSFYRASLLTEDRFGKQRRPQLEAIVQSLSVK
jgi:hypothetical protein